MHRRSRSQIQHNKATPSSESETNDYFFHEVSSEHIDNPFEYVHYVWFNQAKLMFFFQRRCSDPNLCYPMQTFHVNNWLFFRPNIFTQRASAAAQTTACSTPQHASSKISLANNPHTPQHILEKGKRVHKQVRGTVKQSDTLESQIYIIYHKPATVIDVFQISGKHVETFTL